MMVATSGRTMLTQWGAIAILAGILGVVTVAVVVVRVPEESTRALLLSGSDQGITIATPIKISHRIPLTIDRGLVSTDRNRDGDKVPSVVTIDEVALTLDLSGSRPSGSEFSAGPEGRPLSVPQIAGFVSGALRLKRGHLILIGPRGARADLGDVDATVTVTRKGHYKLTGSASYNAHRISIDASWIDTVPREAAQPVPLKMTVRSAVLEGALDGLVKTGDSPVFSGHAEFQIPRMSQFVSWIGLGRGISEQLRSMTVSGPLEWSPNQMSFARASIGLDGYQAAGAMTIKHANDRVVLDATLGFGELDLTRYWPGKITSSGPLGSEPHFMTMLDADLRLSAAKVRVPTFETGRAAVSVALSKGRMQADIVELEIESGSAGGQLSLNLNDEAPKAAIKVRIKGIDAGRTLAAQLKRNPLLGRSNVNFEGTLSGNSLAEAVTSVSGRGQFELAEPGRIGIDVPALVHAARKSGVVGWAAAGKGVTAVESLGGRFRVLNGAITIEAMQARVGSSVLVGSGRLDVPARLMDMSIATGPAGAGEAPITAQDILLLRGTWDTPAISLMRPSKPDLTVDAPARSQ